MRSEVVRSLSKFTGRVQPACIHSATVKSPRYPKAGRNIHANKDLAPGDRPYRLRLSSTVAEWTQLLVEELKSISSND